MSDISLFYGPNAGYLLEQYDRYRENPEAVEPELRALFAHWSPEAPILTDSSASSARQVQSLLAEDTVCAQVDVRRVTGAARLARFIRTRGHVVADTDPLYLQPRTDPELEFEAHGLQTRDLLLLPSSVVGGPIATQTKDAQEAIDRLRQVYTGTIGYEYEHIDNSEERHWLRDTAESDRFFQDFSPEQKRALLARLTQVDTFEQFLHRTFQGAKRFSIEGTDTLVPVLDEVIRCAATTGTKEVVFGMAHRGRLNVLAHVLGKPYRNILTEFEAAHREVSGEKGGEGGDSATGDVKYHLGWNGSYKEGDQEVQLTLVPNPSHLEFVNPVAEGHARAVQEQRAQAGPPVQDVDHSLCVLIHGDAAFPGQGIVAETLNLSSLPGYTTGGTIHIISNNQIGFTTLTNDSRSTFYASDLAKGFEIPIIHVNADDPLACLAAARMAHAYRERFHKDFLIDLIGYRRYGHNEGDEPRYTQPEMYARIDAHPRVRDLWARALEEQGLVTPEEAEAIVADVREQLKAALNEARGKETHDERKDPGMTARSLRIRNARTAVPADRLTQLNDELLARPEGFSANATLERRVLQPRRESLQAEDGINWAHAETLAFASILADGTPIRLTGQDSERGTFGHRNVVLHDTTTGKRYVPLHAMPSARAAFGVYNSPLSENAAMGFEYGYSMHAPGVLVLWEAQFGDFANGAQVIIDQFLAAGNAKWRQTPSLALLLPHGYEGSGPEHSSARLERFLQLAAADNMRVVNATTAAQYFHLLRRQAALLEGDPRPLVVMTPKSLLRDPRAASSLQEFAEGTFQPVLTDPRPQPEKVTRLVLCSGKVYVNLAYGDKPEKRFSERYQQAESVAIVRVEELFPFPAEELRDVIAGYPNLREVLWVQEEPKNMGAWTYMEPRLRELWDNVRYEGRAAAASTAEGSLARHEVEQRRIIAAAFTDVPTPPEAPELEGWGLSARRGGG